MTFPKASHVQAAQSISVGSRPNKIGGHELTCRDVKLAADGELGATGNCHSGTCSHGPIIVGGRVGDVDDTGIKDVSADANGDAYIWHEHPPGADETSTFGHNGNSNDIHKLDPQIQKLYIYTELGKYLYYQLYPNKYTPVDFYVPPVYVP